MDNTTTFEIPIPQLIDGDLPFGGSSPILLSDSASKALAFHRHETLRDIESRLESWFFQLAPGFSGVKVVERRNLEHMTRRVVLDDLEEWIHFVVRYAIARYESTPPPGGHDDWRCNFGRLFSVAAQNRLMRELNKNRVRTLVYLRKLL